MLTIKHLIKSVDRRTQMENFEKYFNEDFDLQEAYDFKNLEAKKVFNREWKEKFNNTLVGKKICQVTPKKGKIPGTMVVSKIYSLVEKVYVGAETGNLFIKSSQLEPINIAEAIFGGSQAKKPYFEAEDPEQTNILLALVADYKEAFHEAALKSNGDNRVEQHATEKLEDQVNTGKTIAENGKKDNVVDWVKDHIINLVFKLPTTDRVEDAPKFLSKKLARIQADLERRYPGITKSKHFELEDKNPETERPNYSFWGLSALTTFDEPYGKFPKELVQMVKDAKDISRQRRKKANQVSDAESTDKTINNIYFAFAILDLLNDDYTLCDKSPANIVNSNDVFKQDFDSVNAYGEKVESLKEAKEEICCICGEPIEGYGNNPRPYKHEGRCCDACNSKFVIPARLAKLNNPEK